MFSARLHAIAYRTCVMDSDTWNHTCVGNGLIDEGVFRNEECRKEYELTGVCQACQDDNPYANETEDEG